MRTLALLLLVGCATIAQAQPPKTYTPGTPPRPGQETILNARVVSVDRAGSRLTVRGVDVKADGGSNETFTVAAPAASRLAELKPGMEVLLTLSGTTVIDVKVSVASGGEAGNVIRGNSKGTFTLQGSPAPASSPTSPRTSKTARPPTRTTGTTRPASRPATGSSPQPAAVEDVPAAGTRPVIGVVPVVGTPSPAAYATPFPTPRPQPTPIPVGTPRPVLLPSEAPSPSQTPTPSPSPQTP
jgi:hypothetical protein